MNGGPFEPLRGVRVLSFEVAYSLPAGTRTLAELGAEVVRVAGPARDSFYVGMTDGVYLSKDCIGINLKDARGLAIAKQLVAKVDIVCSNFVTGVMERLGLGPDDLHAINSSVIVLQLSGYGAPGPWSGYPAFGPSTEAAGGMNHLIGEAGAAPVRVGSGVFSDQLSGRFTALALIAALEERQRTGKGCVIDLSMAEAISMLIGHTVLEASLGLPPEPRRLNRDRDFAPQGVYRCAGDDEWVAITVSDDERWQRLLHVLGEEHASLGRPELEGAAGRQAAHDEIDAVISAWTAPQEKHRVAETLQAAGIAASAVQRSRDPLFDDHLAARALFQSVHHERLVLGYEAHPHPTTPWFAAGHPRHTLRELRFHGGHNTEVFSSWLGMAPEAVAALEAEGVLIVARDVTVEDRATSYNDSDFARQLGLVAGGGE